MTIEFHCPQCSKLLRTADDKAGAQARCPDCGASLTVPQTAAEPHFAADEFDLGDEPGSQPVSQAAPAGGGSPPPIPPGAGTKRCPMCGAEIKAAAIRCRFCGENLGPAPTSRPMPSWVRPHRGGLILALGILSWAICPVCGFMAWIMGNADLKEIRAGVMDPAGEGMTNAGRIVGMVHAILVLVGILIWCLIFGMMIAFGEFN